MHSALKRRRDSLYTAQRFIVVSMPLYRSGFVYSKKYAAFWRKTMAALRSLPVVSWTENTAPPISKKTSLRLITAAPCVFLWVRSPSRPSWNHRFTSSRQPGKRHGPISTEAHPRCGSQQSWRPSKYGILTAKIPLVRGDVPPNTPVSTAPGVARIT